jgi:hypothetical protein
MTRPGPAPIEKSVFHDHDNIMSGHTKAPKRRRTGPPQIGAPSEADKVVTPVNLPSSSAFSTRTVKSSYVLPLTTLCARRFAANFPKLSKDPRQWDPTKEWRVVCRQLESLPDSTIQTIFAMLSSSCPHLLSHELVQEVCLCGFSMIKVCD